MNVNLQLNRIDSLLQIEQLRKADSLLRNISENELDDPAVRLKFEYLQAFYSSTLEDNAAALKIAFNLPEKAIQNQEYRTAALSHILLALIYEKTGSLSSCKNQLDIAAELMKQHQLDSLYGWYYVRKSSYYRFISKTDSAIYCAKAAIPYSEKYNNLRTWADANLLLGVLTSKMDKKLSISYNLKALELFVKQSNYRGAAAMYSNLSFIYEQNGESEKSLKYNDSAIQLSERVLIPDVYYEYQSRSEIYEKLQKHDSALKYYKLYIYGKLKANKENELLEIRKITRQFELEKKDAKLKSQRKWTMAATGAALIISLISFLLFLQNKKIRKQHEKINHQNTELGKLVAQKQILLAELQHRVKNNLQHVLSLLEIQKESILQNNVQDVILENQNRIHSMAILHNKLSFENGKDVLNFDEYLQDMSQLMKSAYRDGQKDISINVQCDRLPLNMDKAMPLGLILVELMSNSLKHAFKNKPNGNILIKVVQDTRGSKVLIAYSDDGVGYDFNNPSKNGLGLELIQGLIKELKGAITSTANNGTHLSISFRK